MGTHWIRVRLTELRPVRLLTTKEGRRQEYRQDKTLPPQTT